MSIVAHKYTPEQMPEPELLATFAAREHTLEFLVNALRRQTGAKTLSSYLVTGPRGAGKSALLRMLRIRIRDDAELSHAWLVVSFPEEQFNVASVRDLLAATLNLLATQEVAAAADWLHRVEAERDDDQSEELAITALREVSQQQHKRLILVVENLDELFDYALSDKMKGTLRRLLMIDPFMMIMGSAAHVFESLERYDEAFFNYFCQVPLPRLNENEVYELLRKRAEFDANESFLKEMPRQAAKIRMMAHLSGGNPRFILMLYELLSQKQVTSAVEELRRLVDELTPLLKHELENLPPQQQKLMHALMEKGGTATPADLVTPTRLSLNAVTTQLRRLKQAQILELHGGGKGRPAYYTVPDKLFSIWYQMRCLNHRRRHIEMFVEVLRIWFEAEERFKVLGELTARTPHRGAAVTAEYFAASLAGTPHEDQARDLCLHLWLRAEDIREAALAHAEFSGLNALGERAFETQAYNDLGQWFLEHEDPQAAVRSLEPVAEQTTDPILLLKYGMALNWSDDRQRAIRMFDRVLQAVPSDNRLLTCALVCRGAAKVGLGDLAEAIADFTRAVDLPGTPAEVAAAVILVRGAAKAERGDPTGAIVDYTAVVGLPGAPVRQVASALLSRGLAKGKGGNATGAIADFTAAIELSGAPVEQVADALVNRAIARGRQDDPAGAITDCTTVLQLTGVTADQAAIALHTRVVAQAIVGNVEAALDDCSKVLQMTEAPVSSQAGAAVAAYGAACAFGQPVKAKSVLVDLRRILAGLNSKERTEILTGWLADLANLVLEDHWQRACRTLLDSQPAEVVEALRAFRTVADILQNGDQSVLDALPPEQRDFALKVLERFQPKPSAEKPEQGKS